MVFRDLEVKIYTNNNQKIIEKLAEMIIIEDKDKLKNEEILLFLKHYTTFMENQGIKTVIIVDQKN